MFKGLNQEKVIKFMCGEVKKNGIHQDRRCLALKITSYCFIAFFVAFFAMIATNNVYFALVSVLAFVAGALGFMSYLFLKYIVEKRAEAKVEVMVEVKTD